VLNVRDIMFAHNVPAFIATRKWRILAFTFTTGTNVVAGFCAYNVWTKFGGGGIELN